MATYKIKHFCTELDEIADNGGIVIGEYEDEFENIADILENFNEDIIISIERIID